MLFINNNVTSLFKLNDVFDITNELIDRRINTITILLKNNKG